MHSIWLPYKHLIQRYSLLLSFLGVGSLLLFWFVSTTFGFISPTKLPTPQSVFNAFCYLAYSNGESKLLVATYYSVGRIFIATLIVILIGIPVGIIMGTAPKINAILSPLIDPFRSAPIVALLPIFVQWLGIGEEMKIAFLVMGGSVYLIPMVRDAIKAVPEGYWTAIIDLGATPFEAIFKNTMPLALPRIADSIIITISVMWTYITVAEYVNAEKGLGQLIQNAKRFSAMDQVFAGIFVIIALALITVVSLTKLKNKLFAWETKV